MKLNKNTKQSWLVFKSKLHDSKNIKLIKKKKKIVKLSSWQKKIIHKNLNSSQIHKASTKNEFYNSNFN